MTIIRTSTHYGGSLGLSFEIYDNFLKDSRLLTYNYKKMLEFLVQKLPRDILTLIYLFDGRIVRAHIREYISSVYSSVFQTYFGRNHNLKYICGSNDPRFDSMRGLPFYSAWTTLILDKYPQFRKDRLSRKFMREYRGLIPLNVLKNARLRIEKSVKKNFNTRLKLISHLNLNT